MLREKELALLENLKTDNERKTEEIRQLRNNQLVGQASGEETATITDGALAFANILEETEIEVEGKKKKAYLVGLPQGISRQEQREGYNILPNLTNIENTNIGGVNYSIVNNEIIAKGTATSGINKKIATTKITLKANTAYTFVLFTKGTAQSSLGSQAILFGTDSISNKISVPFNSDSNSLKNFTSTEDYTFDRISLYVGGTSTGSGIYIDVRIKIMILEGTYTEENLPAYEQYGATPSIEYPSEIENVKAWNLFDKNNVINDKFVSNDIVSNTSWCYYETNNLSTNKKYIVNARTILSFYNEDTNISYLDTQINFDIPISIPENTTKVYISIQKTNLETYMFVEEKDQDKPYAPYGAISIGLGNKNILPITYTKGQHIDSLTGIDIDFIEKNRIKLNGTATSSLNLNTITGATFTWKKGKTYSLQLKIIEGSYSTQSLILHTGFKNEFKDIYNNLQADISNNFKKTITIDEDGYSNKCIIYANSGVVFNNLIVEIQLEENTTTTEIVVPQKQNYPLHIGDLELNGINDIRDSFVVGLDNSYSYKKIKKLYLKKKYNEIIFDIETINNTGFAQGYTNIEKNIYQYRTIHNYITDLLVNPDPFNIKDIALCNYKKKNGPNDNINSVLNDNLFTVSGNKEIVINSNKATYADFKNELIELNNNGNPLKILYPLETPELIDLTDDFPELVQDIEYLINNFKTFKEVTHIEIDNGYIDLEYVKSTELAFKNMQQQIDNIQAVMLEGGTGNA